MRIIRLLAPLAILAGLGFVQPCLAKRMGPAPVAPLVVGATTYRAQATPLGLVEAVDTKSGHTLWTRQIYATRYDPNLEKDVQDRFISSLRAADGGLIVTVEGGAEYFLNLATLEVTRREAPPKTPEPPKANR